VLIKSSEMKAGFEDLKLVTEGTGRLDDEVNLDKQNVS
jgi:hypothetical protein